MSADPRPLPSLFRWEPGMRLADGRIVVDVCGERLVVARLWGSVSQYIERVEADDPARRPDMSHAGTRGLVLEQVRVALGCTQLHVEADEDESWEGDLEAEWFVRRPRGTWYGRGPTEGDALLDALHRAEGRS